MTLTFLLGRRYGDTTIWMLRSSQCRSVYSFLLRALLNAIALMLLLPPPILCLFWLMESTPSDAWKGKDFKYLKSSFRRTLWRESKVWITQHLTQSSPMSLFPVASSGPSAAIQLLVEFPPQTGISASISQPSSLSCSAASCDSRVATSTSRNSFC